LGEAVYAPKHKKFLPVGEENYCRFQKH